MVEIKQIIKNLMLFNIRKHMKYYYEALTVFLLPMVSSLVYFNLKH